MIGPSMHFRNTGPRFRIFRADLKMPGSAMLIPTEEELKVHILASFEVLENP